MRKNIKNYNPQKIGHLYVDNYFSDFFIILDIRAEYYYNDEFIKTKYYMTKVFVSGVSIIEDYNFAENEYEIIK